MQGDPSSRSSSASNHSNRRTSSLTQPEAPPPQAHQGTPALPSLPTPAPASPYQQQQQMATLLHHHQAPPPQALWGLTASTSAFPTPDTWAPSSMAAAVPVLPMPTSTGPHRRGSHSVTSQRYSPYASLDPITTDVPRPRAPSSSDLFDDRRGSLSSTSGGSLSPRRGYASAATPPISPLPPLMPGMLPSISATSRGVAGGQAAGYVQVGLPGMPGMVVHETQAGAGMPMGPIPGQGIAERSMEELQEIIVKEEKRRKNKESSQRFRDRTKEKNKERDDKLTVLERRCRELEGQLASTPRSEADARDRIDRLQRDNDDLRRRLADSNAECDRLRAVTAGGGPATTGAEQHLFAFAAPAGSLPAPGYPSTGTGAAGGVELFPVHPALAGQQQQPGSAQEQPSSLRSTPSLPAGGDSPIDTHQREGSSA